MTSVIHRVVDPNRVFGSQQLLRALSLALQGTKKPGVTRTTGRVMGETQIWPSHFAMASPTCGVIKVGTELHYTIEEISSRWHK